MKLLSKMFVVVLVVLVLLVALVYFFQRNGKVDEDIIPVVNPYEYEEDVEIEKNNLDIRGESEFTTTVTGYLEVLNEELYDQEWDFAYIAISGFGEPSIESKLGDEKLNESGHILFRLGCFEEGEIIGEKYYDDSEDYVDEKTLEALLDSNLDNQVDLELQFGYHLGRGCVCCNLVHKIRVK
ncbi:MAG: hypothetical protein PHU71_03205 [Candidatus Gracilibacteria bacterium]|nr:hypothetical protein [Candidatus Gracilibacteria bacterium]